MTLFKNLRVRARLTFRVCSPSLSPSPSFSPCNFHYNQCIFTKVQEIRLQQDYYNSSNDDPTCVKRLVQETAALAFMSVQEVNDLWCKIMDKFEHIRM